MKDKNPKTSNDASSADNVEQHLKRFEEKTLAESTQRAAIENQLFTKEELAQLINPDKLDSLLEDSDELVGYLTSEINKFDQ
ncbi:MAG: hypothetical protein ACTHYX_02195 [Psychrobacter sp.]|uniref:hypothetical protein n=1 Tax=Psychrobacter sp. TaxID=56811 RepID=UPI003F986578